jgi:hypothetical protein
MPYVLDFINQARKSYTNLISMDDQEDENYKLMQAATAQQSLKFVGNCSMRYNEVFIATITGVTIGTDL